MKRFIPLAAMLSIACLTLFLASCGGGGSGGAGSRATGRFALTVKWPEPSRLIPAASNSIRAVLTGGGATLGQQTLVRPQQGPWTTTVTFENLSAGVVTLGATAFPNADATGTAQAGGSADSTIISGQTAHVTVTMSSTIASLVVTPTPSTVHMAGTEQLIATPKDASGNVVLVAPGNITFSSGTPATATVGQSNGLVTGVAASANAVTITATESESGKSGTASVTVTAPAPSGLPVPKSATVDSTNRFVYVADFGDVFQASGTYHGDLRQFKINADGTLSDLSPSLVTSVDQPISIAAHPSAGFVYVANFGTNTVSQFKINADGTLGPLSPASVNLPTGSSFGGKSPSALTIDPTGKSLFVSSGSSYVADFSINPDGTLAALPTANSSPDQTGVVVTPVTANGQFAYVVDRYNAAGLFKPSIRVFRVNADGSLTDLGTTVTSDLGFFAVAMDPQGRFLYATHENFGGEGTPFSVSIYTIGKNGALTAVGADVAVQSDAFSLTTDPAGKFLYVANQGSGTISEYSVNTDGSLTALSPATVAATAPSWVATSPDGKFLYATNLNGNGGPRAIVTPFRINANGTLTPL